MWTFFFRRPMLPVLLRLLIAISCSYSVVVFAENYPSIGLATGSKSGTYIQIGRDIAKLAEMQGLTIDIYESNGSLENIAAVFEKPDVQLGLVQSDVLGYLQESQNRKLERVAQQIAMMFPLYNEEVHLLARKEIQSIYDLNHKLVAVGNKGSGTNLTSELLFEITNVWPKKKYLLDDKAAIKSLDQGKLDALFYVSGYPVKLLEEVDGERFHLVPLNTQEVADYYIKSTIPAGTYDWQKSSVNTVAVKAVLMTAGFYDDYCPSINKLLSIVRANMPWLHENGHPKWKEVQLDFVLSNWGRYGCSAQSITLLGNSD